MQLMDPSFLVTAQKKPKIVGRQRQFLKGYAERVSFSVGLFCTEVFLPEILTEGIEARMGIPLTAIRQFNVKREVLIYKKDGGLETIPLNEAMAEFQRPECRHCGDFSAELADIVCGGVGTDRATIVVIRTPRGEAIWREFQARGDVEVEPITSNKRAWNTLLRLSRRQRNRVPVGAPRSGTATNLPQYTRLTDAAAAAAKPAFGAKAEGEWRACLEAAYAQQPPPGEIVGYMAGNPIPGDPGPPPATEKRKLPPPLTGAGGSAPE